MLTKNALKQDLRSIIVEKASIEHDDNQLWLREFNKRHRGQSICWQVSRQIAVNIEVQELSLHAIY